MISRTNDLPNFFGVADEEGQVLVGNLLIQWGKVYITPTAANTVTTQNVSFARTFANTPIILASLDTSVPQQLNPIGINNRNIASMQINIFRTNTTTTGVSWIAIGKAS